MNITRHTSHSSDSSDRANWVKFPLTRKDFSLCILLIFIALAVRMPFIVRGNTLLISDEALVGIMAQDILEGKYFPIYFYGQRYMGAPEAYTMALLRLLTDDLFLPLRLAPALYFCLLVGAMFFMLTRWFGRLSGALGALALIAASPFFVQWSIAPRGWYIEILLWGVLFWWAYSEWFIVPQSAERRLPRQFLFGLLIGSGVWLNGMFLAFLLPVFAHALFSRTLGKLRDHTRVGGVLVRLEKMVCGLPLILPFLCLVAVVVANCLWTIWADEIGVHTMILLNVLPPNFALAFIGILFTCCFLLVRKKLLAWLLRRIETNRPIIVGILIGYAPALLYTLRHILSRTPLDDGIPVGIRPIWTIGSTLRYLWDGLPVIFGADPTKYLVMAQLGRLPNVTPLPPELAGHISLLNWGIFFALALIFLVLILTDRKALYRIFQFRAGTYSPPVFLLLAGFMLIGMYVFSGPAFNFVTIRYMLPLWAILPGLFGASISSAKGKLRLVMCIAVIMALACYALGQTCFWLQIGQPHPLEPVAKALQASQVPIAGAEVTDSHILSFLTRQRPPVFEQGRMWPRLKHYRSFIKSDEPVAYVVQTVERDWGKPWTEAKLPGAAAAETHRLLYDELRFLSGKSVRILGRNKLIDGWELWFADHPLPPSY